MRHPVLHIFDILDIVHVVCSALLTLLAPNGLFLCPFSAPFSLICAFPHCFCRFLPFLLLPGVLLPFWACCGVFVPCRHIALQQEVGASLRLLLLPAGECT